MKEYIENPKTKGSGIVCCIPQTGTCPNNCEDCFFQSGRSYLEPLADNLPNMPPPEIADGRVVRVNDGNDSNVNRFDVELSTSHFRECFFNTAIPKDIGKFSRPVVLTVNPAKLTDTGFNKVDYSPNLMFVRIRTNTWNMDSVVIPAVNYYYELKVPIILTFMAYYTDAIPRGYGEDYEWKKRTLNSYWCITQRAQKMVTDEFSDNPYVYTCGFKGQHACKFCGNCLREYYRAKERNKK